jgi:hypothetical protein
MKTERIAFNTEEFLTPLMIPIIGPAKTTITTNQCQTEKDPIAYLQPFHMRHSVVPNLGSTE